MDLPSSPARRRLTQMHQVQEKLLRANREQLARAERAFHRSFSRECTDLRKKWLGQDASPTSQPGSPVPTGASPPNLRRSKSAFQFPEMVSPGTSPSDSEGSLDTLRDENCPDNDDPPLIVGSVDHGLDRQDSAEWSMVLESELASREEHWQREIRRRKEERGRGRQEEREHVAALLSGCQMAKPRSALPVTRVKSLPSYMQSTKATRSKKVSERKLGSDSS